MATNQERALILIKRFELVVQIQTSYWSDQKQRKSFS